MAKAKKKTKSPHINKIMPAVATTSGVLFDKLEAGKCFLMNSGLFMKEAGGDQIALNLATGKYAGSLCGANVTPVVVTITWKRE